ncbi:hypothetical protein ACFWB0_05960 [Rhodococcus sp. NPDC060086]|uniref:hypothetical protein n=1 Tax=Rhodococcus sp. NPDC060086 TaxID=3347055 RepID=UPI00365F3004
MTNTLEADLPQIRSVSRHFDLHAEELCEIDTSQMKTHSTSGFLQASSVAAALGDAEAATRRALLILADRAWALHDTMNRVCEDYSHTEEYFRDELARAVSA